MIHRLKTWPHYFEEIGFGTKTAEYRRNDRGYEVGDVLCFEEYDPELKVYCGRTIEAVITHKLENAPQVGLPDGYCVLSIWLITGSMKWKPSLCGMEAAPC